MNESKIEASGMKVNAKGNPLSADANTEARRGANASENINGRVRRRALSFQRSVFACCKPMPWRLRR